ncbi:MAG TPA: hypothetical protein VN818_07385 [Gammaproteobacteria bacterium]|nr:hypothetical protein [Gammaproteobacteria bacterium]
MPPLRSSTANIRADENDDQQESAGQRRVFADECLLRRLGDDQQEHEIERRRVAQRALAADTKDQQQK